MVEQEKKKNYDEEEEERKWITTRREKRKYMHVRMSSNLISAQQHQALERSNISTERMRRNQRGFTSRKFLDKLSQNEQSDGVFVGSCKPHKAGQNRTG